MHYSVDTTCKFAYFADSDVEEADPEELIQKAKREQESEKLAKEKAKKEEKDKTKKSKGKEVPVAAPSQPTQSKTKDTPKVVQNAQSNKPPRLSRPKADEEGQNRPLMQQQGEREETSSARQQSDVSAEPGSQTDRPMRGGRGGFRGGRGRGSFAPRDDGFQGFSEGNVMGEPREFRRGGFRGRGGRRGFGVGAGIHPQERHSGSRVTGIKAVEKRNGAGAHNWGSEQDELDLIDSDKLQSGIVEVHPEAANVAGDINADENVPPTVTEAEEAKEDKDIDQETNEPHDMTVEEYLAKSVGERERLAGVVGVGQKKNKKKAPVIAEGKTTAFTGMVAYVKKSTPEDEESEEEFEEGEDSEDNPKRKRTLEVPFRQNRSGGFTGRGGRGGRGRGRGAGDFRGGRGGRGGAPASAGREQVELHLTSDVDFPSL
jgi:plasminogen activator inhibitor 1 RNA-binding protein